MFKELDIETCRIATSSQHHQIFVYETDSFFFPQWEFNAQRKIKQTNTPTSNTKNSKKSFRTCKTKQEVMKTEKPRMQKVTCSTNKIVCAVCNGTFIYTLNGEFYDVS